MQIPKGDSFVCQLKFGSLFGEPFRIGQVWTCVPYLRMFNGMVADKRLGSAVELKITRVLIRKWLQFLP